jgi:hypothetical protein
VNEIEKDIFDLPERLKRGIPFEALHNVNALVGKAEKYNVQITHTLINKCYNVLNQRHIYFSLMMPQNIQFPSGCNSRNKCGRQLQILKLEVETKSRTIERTWMGNEESKESFWEKNRHSHQEKEEKEKIKKEVAEVKTKIPTCEAGMLILKCVLCWCWCGMLMWRWRLWSVELQTTDARAGTVLGIDTAL